MDALPIHRQASDETMLAMALGGKYAGATLGALAIDDLQDLLGWARSTNFRRRVLAVLKSKRAKDRRRPPARNSWELRERGNQCLSF